MELKHKKILLKGTVVEFNGVPVEIQSDVEVASNTDFENLE